jgi:hypothetical protein
MVVAVWAILTRSLSLSHGFCKAAAIVSAYPSSSALAHPGTSRNASRRSGFKRVDAVTMSFESSHVEVLVDGSHRENTRCAV